MDEALAALRSANDDTDIERALDMVVAIRAPAITERERRWREELAKERARSGGDLRREKGEARLHQELVHREREMSKVKAENARLRTDLEFVRRREQEYIIRYEDLVPELETARLNAAEGQAAVEHLASVEHDKQSVTLDYRSLVQEFQVLQDKSMKAEENVKLLEERVAVLEVQLTATTAAKKALKDTNLDLISRIEKHEAQWRIQADLVTKGKTLLTTQSEKYQAEMMALERKFESVRAINRGLCNWLVECRGRRESW